MNKQLFVDRLLETENLTDNLENGDAKVLLNWGLAQIDPLIEGGTDEGKANERITGLMSLMRALNFLASDLQNIGQDAIADLLTQHGQTFNYLVKVDESECRALAERVSIMKPGKAVAYLADWLDNKRP